MSPDVPPIEDQPVAPHGTWVAEQPLEDAVGVLVGHMRWEPAGDDVTPRGPLHDQPHDGLGTWQMGPGQQVTWVPVIDGES